jgi:hypothetical protein
VRNAAEPESPPVRNDICTRCGKRYPRFFPLPAMRLHPRDPSEPEKPSIAKRLRRSRRPETTPALRQEIAVKNAGDEFPAVSRPVHTAVHPDDATAAATEENSPPERLLTTNRGRDHLLPAVRPRVKRHTGLPALRLSFSDELRHGPSAPADQAAAARGDPKRLNDSTASTVPMRAAIFRRKERLPILRIRSLR